jgi:tetratricopeptide (TPR) repeat protein
MSRKRSAKAPSEQGIAETDSVGGPGKPAVALLAVVIGFAIFAPTVAFEFTNWDDGINVTENPYLNPVSADNLKFLWTHAYRRLYVPLAYTSFALEAVLWDMKPAGFHFTNTLLHALSCGLVFLILRQLLANSGGALVGALLFAVHPLQVEPVAWVTGRKDVLSGFLALLAIHQYVRWSQHGRWASYVVATLAFVLALTSKPGAVAVPLVALAVDRLYLKRPLGRSLIAVLPWLLVAAGWVVLTMWAQPPGEFADEPVSWWQRPFIAGDAVAFYLSKLVVPVGMVAVYDRPPVTVLSHWWVYVTPVVPLVLAVLLVWRGNPALRTGGAVVLAALLPVLGFIRFTYQEYSTVADRYFYLSMLGVALAAGWFYDWWRRSRGGGSRVLRVVAVVVLVVLAVKTLAQQRVWRDSYALWTHNLEWRPACPLANYNLGRIFTERDDPAKAVERYRRAIASRPNYMKARHNLANELYRLGLWAKREGHETEAREWCQQAREQFEYQLAADPDVSTVYFNASLLYAELGDQQRVEDLLTKAIQYKPLLADAYVNLGNIYGKRGEYEAAKAQYRAALRIEPDHPQALSNLRVLEQMRAQGYTPGRP